MRGLRRRHGRSGRASSARPFQVVYDWAGVRYGRGSTPTERFAEANRAAMEIVRSGKSKHAAVVYTAPKRIGDSTAPKEQVVAEYIMSPSGGVQAVSVGA